MYLYRVWTVGIGSICYVFILSWKHTDREHLLFVYFSFSEPLEGTCVLNRVFLCAQCELWIRMHWVQWNILQSNLACYCSRLLYIFSPFKLFLCLELPQLKLKLIVSCLSWPIPFIFLLYFASVIHFVENPRNSVIANMNNLKLISFHVDTEFLNIKLNIELFANSGC